MKRAALLFAALFALAACENVDRQMHDQISFKTQEFPRKGNPPGSVAMFGQKADYADVEPTTLEPPFPLNEETAKKGKKLFGIYCGVCHGPDGKAETPVAKIMDLPPPNLTIDNALELTDGEIFWTIVASDTIMPKYRNELSDKEAWEITAYTRYLQNKL